MPSKTFDYIANSEKIDFVPEFVHSLQDGLHSSGRHYLKVEIEDIVCRMVVGVPNRVEKPFYDTYVNCLEIERLDKRGFLPPTEPNRVDRDGAYTWFVEVGSVDESESESKDSKEENTDD